MSNCDGCIYMQDRNKLLSGGLIWGSTQPHPCSICKRFPKDQESLPDNYRTPTTTFTVEG